MEDLIKILSDDKLYYADMIYALKNIDDIKILYSENDGILLLSGENKSYLMSAKNANAAVKMANLIELQHFDIFLHEMRYSKEVMEVKGQMDMMPCMQYVYTKDDNPPITSIPGIDIKLLNRSHLRFLLDNYHETEETFEKAIKLGMIGAFDKDKCIGFMGYRIMGELGLLKVLPEYRQMGIASALESRLMAKRIKNKDLCFADIVPGNTPSETLHKSLGFTKPENLSVWLSK